MAPVCVVIPSNQAEMEVTRADGSFCTVYGKWPFYRLGPIQEPFSVLMSLGNLYVNLRGLSELRRRVRPENKLRKWLEMAGWAQVNTWIWSAVFHTRGEQSIDRFHAATDTPPDKPLTERLDYFSATITVAFSLIYAILRVLHLQTPLSTSRLAFPAVALVAFLVLSHFTYLLSFPLGRFPYGYHTAFVVCLGMAHNLLWIAWSLSFRIAYPTLTLGSRTIAFPNPYPPHDPRTTPSLNAMTPLSLVILTILAMSLEVFDFHPIFRVADAHSLWHLATIPLAVGWWAFFCQDALDFEGSLMNARFVAGANIGDDEKMPLASPSPIRVTAGMGDLQSVRTPNTPAFAQLAAMPPPPRRTPRSSPRPSPGRSERED